MQREPLLRRGLRWCGLALAWAFFALLFCATVVGPVVCMFFDCGV